MYAFFVICGCRLLYNINCTLNTRSGRIARGKPPWEIQIFIFTARVVRRA
jgi:hypothetical protein